MIELPRSEREGMLRHARNASPEEACGVLGGAYNLEHSRVTSVQPTENAADAPRQRYEIDPAELYTIVEELESEGEEIVGFYHSHPHGPARPSETDLAEATWRDYSYLIVVPDDEPAVSAWRYRANGFECERLEVTDGPS